MRWLASENLFISQNNTLFHRIFDALSQKAIKTSKMVLMFLKDCFLTISSKLDEILKFCLLDLSKPNQTKPSQTKKN